MKLKKTDADGFGFYLVGLVPGPGRVQSHHRVNIMVLLEASVRHAAASHKHMKAGWEMWQLKRYQSLPVSPVAVKEGPANVSI